MEPHLKVSQSSILSGNSVFSDFKIKIKNVKKEKCENVRKGMALEKKFTFSQSELCAKITSKFA